MQYSELICVSHSASYTIDGNVEFSDWIDPVSSGMDGIIVGFKRIHAIQNGHGGKESCPVTFQMATSCFTHVVAMFLPMENPRISVFV